MIIDEPWIFSGWHTLKPGEALRQVRALLTTNPTSGLTREFRAELLSLIESADTRKVLPMTRRVGNDRKVRTIEIQRHIKRSKRKP